MKVLLVHAYSLATDPAEQKVMKPFPPLGLLYLSAYLKWDGHEVEIFDGTFARPEDFPGILRHFAPRAVGFYANMMTRSATLRLRGMIAETKIPMIVGGPDPPHYLEAYLDAGFVACVVGEGERAMSAWLQQLDQPDSWSRIPGLVFRREGVLVRGPTQNNDLPLDSLPLPDRKAIDLNTYLDCWERHHGIRPISLVTARGCPFRCTWCSHNVFGYSFRKRSVDNVRMEMAELQEHYRFDHYWFADDVFTIQPKWVFGLRDSLRQYPELVKPFECISRADKITPELVDALRELRCFRLWIGAESGSERLLSLMKRGVNREQVIRAATLARTAGIETGMFFMWGFMDEDYPDISDTVSLAAACRPDIALTTIAYPIKGTVFYEQLAQQGLLHQEPRFEQGTDRDIRIHNQPSPDLYTYANSLLHGTIRAGRLREGSLLEKTRAWVLRARTLLARYRLEQAFRAHRRRLTG